MRIRIDGDVARVASFLRLNGYPHPWSVNTLQKHAIMVRIETTARGYPEAVGYVWATWHALMPDTLDFHVCIAREFRGVWLRDKSVWNDLVTLARFLGAKIVVTRAPDDTMRRLTSALLSRRFGFTIAEDGTAFKHIED